MNIHFCRKNKFVYLLRSIIQSNWWINWTRKCFWFEVSDIFIIIILVARLHNEYIYRRNNGGCIVHCALRRSGGISDVYTYELLMWAEFVYCTGSHSVLIIRKICTCFIINVNEEIPEETNMRKFGNKWYWTELLCSALMAP